MTSCKNHCNNSSETFTVYLEKRAKKGNTYVCSVRD